MTTSKVTSSEASPLIGDYDEILTTRKALNNRKNKQFGEYDGTTKFEAIVFEGGGSKGVSYGGALRRLGEAGILSSIKMIGGTSAGAQTAAYLACGCSPDEISNINANLDWSKVFDKSAKCCAAASNMRRLLKTYAECTGEYLLGAIEENIAKKTGRTNLTFQGLFALKGTDLHIGTCDLITNSFVMLTKETHGDMPISLAAMASSTLPLVFPPIRWKKSLFVDGGLQGNLPLQAFPGRRMLAMHLHPDVKDDDDGNEVVDSFGSFLGSLINTLFWGAQHGQGFCKDENTREHLLSLHKDKGIDVINVDCGDCQTMEPEMSKARLAMIEKLGYESVNDWLGNCVV